MKRKKEFISPKEEKKIVKAIQKAEQRTSGEIRVHIEANCNGNIADKAKEVFYKLNMKNTKQRNGVLFYVAANNKQFYILGDKGIHQVVPENFWKSTIKVMLPYFKKKQFDQGLIEGILKAGKQLNKHFPHIEDDKNELPDEISRG